MKKSVKKKISLRFRLFRDLVRNAIADLLFNRVAPDSELTASDIKKILFIRLDGKIGDTLISNVIYREIKAHRPDITVHVIASAQNENLFRSNPHVDKVLVCENSRKTLHLLQSLSFVRKQRYDVVVHLTSKLKPRDIIFLRYANAKQVWCTDTHVKFASVYNAPVDNDLHFSEHCYDVLRCLQIRNYDPIYPILLESQSVEKVQLYLKDQAISTPVVFNPYGATEDRQIDQRRVLEILAMIREQFDDKAIFIIFAPNKLAEVEQLLAASDDDLVQTLPWQASMDDTIALIAEAQLVVSVDTAIIHVATGLSKPLIGIYQSNKVNFTLWHPNNEQSSVVFAAPWENAHTRRNIGEFSNQEFITALKQRKQALVELEN